MLLVGFPVHEFAHAFAAYRLGDGTAKLFGRLTLNPIVHFDPIGGVLLAASFLASQGAFAIGWAKPTPVNPNNLRGGRQGEAIVAARRARCRTWSWPLARRRSRCGSHSRLRRSGSTPRSSSRCWTCSCVINIILMVFNLIPIPPLDGSKVLFAALDRQTDVPDPPVPRAVRVPHPARRLLPAARPLGRQPGAVPHHRRDLWLPGGRGKVRQFRSHLRARVSPAERADLAAWICTGAAGAVRLDARRRPPPRARRRRLAARGRRDRSRPAAGGPAPRRRQGRHRHLAAGRLLARPALRDVGLGRAPVAAGLRPGARAAARPTRRPRPRSRSVPVARSGPWT